MSSISFLNGTMSNPSIKLFHLNEKLKSLINERKEWLSDKTGETFERNDICNSCYSHEFACECEIFNGIDEQTSVIYDQINEINMNDSKKCHDCHMLNVTHETDINIANDYESKVCCVDGCIIRSPCGHINQMMTLRRFKSLHPEYKINCYSIFDNFMLPYTCHCCDDIHKPKQMWFGSRIDNRHDCVEEEWSYEDENGNKHLLCELFVNLEPLCEEF